MSRDPPADLSNGRAIAPALRSIAAVSGRGFWMETKAGRFRVQKAVFLLQKMGYRPAQTFGYNLYLNGPYSTDLAVQYYGLGTGGLQEGPPATDLPEPLVRTVREALSHDDEFLEALCTTLSLRESTRSLGESIERARALKGHLRAHVWQEVLSFLREHPLLTRRT